MHTMSQPGPAAQHSVQLTVGTLPFLGICLALGFVRFDSESTLPPTAANARRWAKRL